MATLKSLVTDEEAVSWPCQSNPIAMFWLAETYSASPLEFLSSKSRIDKLGGGVGYVYPVSPAWLTPQNPAAQR